ncbi:MAG: hypothetical protein KGL39_00455 [Patescibacteria group bacterium]|nr:hypothetical protein [Patescibacteria group bacterium]
MEVPSVHGGEPAMLPDPSELFGEWEILDIVEKRVQVNMGDQKVLTDKGTAAVEEMDNRYKELCQEFGTDPDDWRPDVWIKANEDFLLDWNLRAARQRFSTSSAS